MHNTTDCFLNNDDKTQMHFVVFKYLKEVIYWGKN